MTPDRQFFMEDWNKYLDNPSVQALNVMALSEADLAAIVNGAGVTICGWCYSELSPPLLRALGLIK